MGVDYAFSDGEDHEKNFPIMVMKDSNSKVIFSNSVPCKGTKHPFPVKQACFNLKQLGYKKIILRSDQEPAIVDLCNKNKDSVDIEIIPENSAVGESQSNGMIERGIQEVGNITRVLKDSGEHRYGITPDAKHPVLA